MGILGNYAAKREIIPGNHNSGSEGEKLILQQKLALEVQGYE